VFSIPGICIKIHSVSSIQLPDTLWPLVLICHSPQIYFRSQVAVICAHLSWEWVVLPGWCESGPGCAQSTVVIASGTATGGGEGAAGQLQEEGDFDMSLEEG
jgi:hypothetical protein